MARPRRGYGDLLPEEFRKELCPGSTTVSKMASDSGGLIHWAWKLGKEGKDYRDARDAAMGAGTLIHEMVEMHARKDAPEKIQEHAEKHPELFDAANVGFRAYLEWAQQTRLEIIAQEEAMVARTKDGFWFGGTLDAIGWCNKKLSLIDWKTGAGGVVYLENLLQIASYSNAWEQNNPADTLEAWHVIRFGRETGGFHHHSYPAEVIDMAWKVFQHLRAAYQELPQLKKWC